MFGEIAPKFRGNQPPQSFGSQAYQVLGASVAVGTTPTTILTLTLNPGTYLLFAEAFGNNVSSGAWTFDARIYDSTAGTTLAGGSTTLGGSNYTGSVSLCVPLVLTSSHTIQLQTQASNAGTVSILPTTSIGSFPKATTFFAVQVTGGTMQLPPSPASSPPLFTSAPLTITAGSLSTVSHGLGRIPYFVHARFVWTSADANALYAVGDTVFIPMQANTYFTGSTEYSGGCVSRVDSTNIYCQVSSSGIIVPRKTDGAELYITLSDGYLLLFAW
ncbi:MAG TPA: hypothetical protein V6C97_08800 [Oculatellaceae cyanobacterium]